MIDVYLETGDKYIFAGALEWPGWCRRGRDREQALQALMDYGPRYAAVLHESGFGFQPPQSVKDLIVTEELPGSAATDFGAPEAIPVVDLAALDDATAGRYGAIVDACWQAFASALTASEGKDLRKGPRGGGRNQEQILLHVVESGLSYLRAAGYKVSMDKAAATSDQIQFARQSSLAALEAAAAGRLPSRGPRGGKIWPPRYFVRRAAWHILDHTWEIEDRVVQE